jgi:hypothetical protein
MRATCNEIRETSAFFNNFKVHYQYIALDAFDVCALNRDDAQPGLLPPVFWLAHFSAVFISAIALPLHLVSYGVI